jgi:G3E family GTPase
MNNNSSHLNVTDNSKEAIITIVGFLGAGKTTLLKYLTKVYSKEGWDPFIILNDYENADLDALQFIDQVNQKSIQSLSGSCICCSGIHVLREFVNQIPLRNHGVTLIEANGTTDACSLAGFLGVGLDERFLPPIQLSVVNVKDWRKRGEHNELEANQIQLSSLIVLTHLDDISTDRKTEVIEDIQSINSIAKISYLEELDIALLPTLSPPNNEVKKIDHLKAHWSSCSVDLPELPNKDSIRLLCNDIPKSILRVKGCAKISGEETLTYFERTPDGQITIRPFNGVQSVGTKLLTVGLGSEASLLNQSIKNILTNESLEIDKM